MVTLRQIKNYLSINNSSEDEVLSTMYNLSLGLIESYCGRKFQQDDVVDELLQGNNRAYLKTDITPLLEINKVVINNKEIDKGEFSIKHNMLFYPKLFPSKYGYVNNKLSAYKREYNIKVSYKAGYLFPNFDDIVNEGTVPQDLQYVCLELIKKIYLNSGVMGQIQTKTISTGGESVAKQYFKQNEKELYTYDIKTVLNKYR